MKKGQKVRNYIVGTVVILLVLTGIVSLSSMAVKKIKASTDNTEKLREYESFISPIIMNDPDTFDDVSKAQPEQLISIAIWSILQSPTETDKYKYTDDGMLMPSAEVEAELIRLFGQEAVFNHCSVDGGGVEFKYSDKKSCYVIPITGIEPLFTPRVLKAKEKGNTVVLSVGYLSGEKWEYDSSGNVVPPEPSKYVKITLRKTRQDTYYLSALQLAEQP